jgi:hypothetical protein
MFQTSAQGFCRRIIDKGSCLLDRGVVRNKVVTVLRSRTLFDSNPQQVAS